MPDEMQSMLQYLFNLWGFNLKKQDSLLFIQN